MANRKSRTASLSQPSLRNVPGSPIRILTRSCSQNNANAASPLETEPLPASSLSTAAQSRPTPSAPLQATAPSVANNALEEQPTTASSELAKHSQDEDCPPGNYTCNNSNVNRKCGTTTDDGSQMVQCEPCGSWSHLHCAGLTARSAKKATFKCHTCNPSAQKKSSQRASNTKTSKSSKKSNSSTSTTPAATTSTTTAAATPAAPNATLGEGNASSCTTLHDHCLCSVGDSCDRCRTVHPVAFATKVEVDSLLQRVLDLEVRLKTENKALRLQVLALEERNDHLETEIALLRSKTSNKVKPPSTNNTNNKGRVKAARPKNSLPPPSQIPTSKLNRGPNTHWKFHFQSSGY